MKMDKEVMQEVKMYQSNGWDIKEDTPYYVLLKRNTGTPMGHILVLIFTWWTFGLSNLLYWAICNQTKKIMK